VILVDANLLFYAYDSSSAQHEPARKWLETTLSEPEPSAFPWMTILAFLRISTNAHALKAAVFHRRWLRDRF
jgi:uncharacterized protein